MAGHQKSQLARRAGQPPTVNIHSNEIWYKQMRRDAGIHRRCRNLRLLVQIR